VRGRPPPTAVGRAVGAVLGLWLAGLVVAAWGLQHPLPPGWSVVEVPRAVGAVADVADPPDPRAFRLEPLSAVALPEDVADVAFAVELGADDDLFIDADGLRIGLRAGQPPRIDTGSCEAPMAAVGDRVRVSLRREEGAVALSLDGAATRCEGAGWPARLATGAGRVQLRVGADGRGPLSPLLAVAGLGLGVLVGVAAGGSLRRGLWLMLPGLVLGSASVFVDPAELAARLRVTALTEAGAAPWGGALLAFFGAGVAACWGLLGSRARLPPWLSLLLGLSWGPLAVLRVRDGGPPTAGSLAIGAGLGLICAGLATLGARRLARPETAGAVAVAVSGLGALAAASGGAAGLVPPVAIVALALAGAALAAILWANRNAVRGFNGLSLLLAVVLLGGVEVAVAHSRSAAGWQAASAWAQRTRALAAAQVAVIEDPADAAGASFAALQAARPTAYPSRGYPVAFGPKRAPTRIVAFGGSSTGGAWQFDDLSAFYPARLDALLGPDVEVVNQGVGGWTSFHVARYAEQRLAELAPDVVTLYAGNNDSAAGYPATIAELYARWSGPGRAGPLQRLLERSAILRWLRQLRAAPAPEGGVPAVRPDELADNLTTLLAACRAQRASLVLIAEANVGDNPALAPYREVMTVTAAAEPDTWYLDGNALLSGHPELFLDNVHLSEAGHQRLAEALADFLLDHELVAEAP